MAARPQLVSKTANHDRGIEKPLPSDVNAERMVLGSVILDNSRWSIAVEKLRAEEFFDPRHREIFSAMVELVSRSLEIHPENLVPYLAAQEKLEAVGGGPYLSQLTDGLHRPNIEELVR